MDLLRDELSEPFEREARRLVADDPWQARDRYISVILNRSQEGIDGFFSDLGRSTPQGDDLVRALKLMELQRHLILMYTSCAWFFDEISGIETVQNIQYAYRVIELARDLFDYDLEPAFREQLRHCPSNLSSIVSGDRVIDEYVRPSRMDSLKLGAHFAVRSLLEEEADTTSIYCYDVGLADHRKFMAGKAQMSCGRITLTSRITREVDRLDFCVIHFGDHNMNVGVRRARNEDEFERMRSETEQVFGRADFPQLVRVLDRHFAGGLFSLKDLFRDEQKRATNQVLTQTLEAVEGEFRQIYEQHYPLMCYLSDIHIPLPPVFRNIAEFVQNAGLKSALISEPPDVNAFKRYVAEAKSWNVVVDSAGVGRAIGKVVNRLMDALESDPTQTELLSDIVELVLASKELPFEVDLGSLQNRYYHWSRERRFVIDETFKRLGAVLKVRVSTP